jgi:hypothetical protein
MTKVGEPLLGSGGVIVVVVLLVVVVVAVTRSMMALIVGFNGMYNCMLIYQNKPNKIGRKVLRLPSVFIVIQHTI